jgi:hypothetical protein
MGGAARTKRDTRTRRPRHLPNGGVRGMMRRAWSKPHSRHLVAQAPGLEVPKQFTKLGCHRAHFPPIVVEAVRPVILNRFQSPSLHDKRDITLREWSSFITIRGRFSSGGELPRETRTRAARGGRRVGGEAPFSQAIPSAITGSRWTGPGKQSRLSYRGVTNQRSLGIM